MRHPWPGILTSFTLLVFGAAQSFADDAPATFKITSPVPYQVIQREGFVPQFAHANALGGPALGFADVLVRFESKPTNNHDLEYRIVDLAQNQSVTEWKRPVLYTVNPNGEQMTNFRIPAGGWYRLELRYRSGENVVATGSVEPIGVGEVFLIAGQSYATNANDESLKVEDPHGRVTIFDLNTKSWRVAHDPQPAPDGTQAGSIWPPFGDTMVSLTGVPVGLVNVAWGGTSSKQWMPDGDLHNRLLQALQTVPHVRAVLWQQGESDVIEHAPTAEYVERLKEIRAAVPNSPVWLLAKSTLHPTVYIDPVGEGRIRAAIDELTKLPGFGPGPDTDTLGGDNRGPVDSKRHFSPIGQRRAALLWTVAAMNEINRPRPKHEVALRMLPDLHLLGGIWSSPIVHRESSILLQESPDGPITARLAFPAKEVKEVRSARPGRVYEIGKDVMLSEDGLVLTFTKPEPVAVIAAKDLYPATDSPNSYKHRVGHPEQSLLFQPGTWFHDRNVEITYTKRDTAWHGTPPALAGEQLPRTLACLKSRQPFTLGISGDSISTGADASEIGAAPPFQPGYPDLLAAQLQEFYHCPIKLVNRAVGGWSITHGRDDLDRMLAEKPDLLIVAYGMNDVGRRDPAWFGQQVKGFIDHARKQSPETEILLVSSMLGNKEWVHTPREMFGHYRDELAKFVGPGVALADVTGVWETVVKNKLDLDMTGNGLNHPNDFGHRLYAQVILGYLRPTWDGSIRKPGTTEDSK